MKNENDFFFNAMIDWLWYKYRIACWSEEGQHGRGWVFFFFFFKKKFFLKVDGQAKLPHGLKVVKRVHRGDVKDDLLTRLGSRVLVLRVHKALVTAAVVVISRLDKKKKFFF